MKKKSVIVFFMYIVLLLSCLGCNKEKTVVIHYNQTNTKEVKHTGEKLKIYGGETVRYSVCFDSTMDYKQRFALPLIVSKKVDSFVLTSVKTTGEGKYTWSCSEFYSKEAYKYKGWHVYWFVLEVGIDSYKEAADFSINALNLVLNGENYTYKIPYFKVVNTKGYNDEIVYDGNENIQFSGNADLSYSVIPNDKNNPVQTGITASKSAYICGFSALDCVKVKNLELKQDGIQIPADFKDGNNLIHLDEGESMTFQYNLEYKENVDENKLVKTSKIILYHNKRDDLCMFCDNTGFCVTNSDNDKNIKEYIKTLPKNK